MPSSSTSSLSDAEVASAMRARMPDLYFVNTPLTRMRRDLDCLRRLPHEDVILEFHRTPHSLLTELTLCSYDAERPGLLSRVSGALLASKININTAFISTLPDEKDGARRVALDTLLVSETYRRRPRSLSPQKEAQAREKLTQLLHESAAPLLPTLRALRPQQPVVIYELTAQTEGDFTVIKLAAKDHPGVLFRMTTALATLGLNIIQGQVNTFESSVDDIFYVARADGRSFNSEELLRLKARLRAQLQK